MALPTNELKFHAVYYLIQNLDKYLTTKFVMAKKITLILSLEA